MLSFPPECSSMAEVTTDSEQTHDLLARVRGGDRSALDHLLAEHRPYLQRLVELRFDPQLRSRADPSDVVQEALFEAAQRIDDYLRREPMPFWLWLRQTACEQLVVLQRRHLGAACRAAGRELPLPAGSSVLLARQLLATGSTPSEQVAGAELAERVRQAIARLDDDDQSIVLLRTYEGLTNQQAAAVLELDPAAASKRFGRALLRLRDIFLTLVAGSES
jgi:RNA polymerase sigma-70 factor (ECF subfamily)